MDPGSGCWFFDSFKCTPTWHSKQKQGCIQNINLNFLLFTGDAQFKEGNEREKSGNSKCNRQTEKVPEGSTLVISCSEGLVTDLVERGQGGILGLHQIEKYCSDE